MRRKLLSLFLLAVIIIYPIHAWCRMEWANNATSLIANSGGISSGATSVSVTNSEGDLFPVITAPHYSMITLADTSGNREIVKCTSRASGSDVLTITRGQESTTPRAWNEGDYIQLRVTADSLDEFSRSAEITQNYYVCDASAVDQAATTNDHSLASLVADIGTSLNATIVLPHTGTGNTTTYTVSQNLDLSSYTNIAFVFERGAMLSIGSNNVTLANIPVAYEDSKIFSASASTLKFPVGTTVYPEWWGAARDGTTDDDNALQYAINSSNSSAQITVKLSSGTYLFDTTLTENGSIKLIGSGIEHTVLKRKTGATGASISFGFNTETILKDFTLDCNNAGGTGISLSGITELSRIENVKVLNCTSNFAVNIDSPQGAKIYNLIIDSTSYAGSMQLYISDFLSTGTGLDIYGLKTLGSTLPSIANIYINCPNVRIYGLHAENGLHLTKAIRIDSDNCLISGGKIITEDNTKTYTQLFYLESGAEGNIIRDVNIEKGSSDTITSAVQDDELSKTIAYQTSFNEYSQVPISQGFNTLANSATPSVSMGNNFVTGGTTTITNFTEGLEGQQLNIVSEHSLIFSGGNNLDFRDNNGLLSLISGDTLSMIFGNDNKWHEMGRKLGYYVGKFVKEQADGYGSDSYTGIGFKPRALIFIAIDAGTTEFSIGFDDGTTAYDIHYASSNYDANSTHSIIQYEGSNDEYQGAVSSMDDDGFTMGWTTVGNQTGTMTVNYIAIE